MKKQIAVLTASIALIGCVAVPQTRVNFKSGTFSSPKDDALQGLSVDYYTSNGVVHTVTTIANASAKNNPDVIAASAVGQVSIINAYGAAISQAIQTGMQIAAAAYGVPIPTTTPTPTSGTVSNTSPIIPAQ